MITAKKYNLITLSRNFIIYSSVLNEVFLITDAQQVKSALTKEINDFIENPKLMIYPKEIITLVAQIMHQIIINKLSILKISTENIGNMYIPLKANSNPQLLEKILEKREHYVYYDLGNFLSLINNFYPQLYLFFGSKEDQFNNWILRWNQLNLKNSPNKLLIQDFEQKPIVKKITIRELLNSKTVFYIFLVTIMFTFILYTIIVCTLKYQINIY